MFSTISTASAPAAQRSGGGLGLVTMEERINLIGGDVSIASKVGAGTTVRVRGPANPARPASQG